MSGYMDVTITKAAEVTERGQTVQDWANATEVAKVKARVQPVSTRPFGRRDLANISDIERLARMRVMFYRGQLTLTPGWHRVTVDSVEYNVRNHHQWPIHTETVLEEVS